MIPEKDDRHLGRQITELKAQGYKVRQICQELQITRDRVNKHLKQDRIRTERATLLADMYEMVLEMLTLMRQLSRLPRREIDRRMEEIRAREYDPNKIPPPAGG